MLVANAVIMLWFQAGFTPFWYDDPAPFVPSCLILVQISKGVQLVCSPIKKLASK